MIETAFIIIAITVAIIIGILGILATIN